MKVFFFNFSYFLSTLLPLLSSTILYPKVSISSLILSAKVKSGDLIIVENADIKDAKTKEASKLLKALAPKNACIIDAVTANESMTQAIANLHGYDILPTIGANVYDIVRKEKLIITKDALKTLEERLNG